MDLYPNTDYFPKGSDQELGELLAIKRVEQLKWAMDECSDMAAPSYVFQRYDQIMRISPKVGQSQLYHCLFID